MGNEVKGGPGDGILRTMQAAEGAPWLGISAAPGVGKSITALAAAISAAAYYGLGRIMRVTTAGRMAGKYPKPPSGRLVKGGTLAWLEQVEPTPDILKGLGETIATKRAVLLLDDDSTLFVSIRRGWHDAVSKEREKLGKTPLGDYPAQAWEEIHALRDAFLRGVAASGMPVIWVYREEGIYGWSSVTRTPQNFGVQLRGANEAGIGNTANLRLHRAEGGRRTLEVVNDRTWGMSGGEITARSPAEVRENVGRVLAPFWRRCELTEHQGVCLEPMAGVEWGEVLRTRDKAQREAHIAFLETVLRAAWPSDTAGDKGARRDAIYHLSAGRGSLEAATSAELAAAVAEVRAGGIRRAAVVGGASLQTLTAETLA